MNMSSLMSATMTTSVAMTMVFVIGMYIVYRDLKRLEAAVDRLQFQMTQGAESATPDAIYDTLDHDGGGEYNGQDPEDYDEYTDEEVVAGKVTVDAPDEDEDEDEDVDTVAPIADDP